MKKVWAALVAVVAMVAIAGSAEACGGRNECCAPPPCQPVQVTYVEKVVTCYKSQLVEREVQCVVNKVVCKTIDVPCKICTQEQVWTEQKRTYVVCKLVPREVEQVVTRCRTVSETVKDPCTGCLVTRCRPETYTEKVKTTVCDTVQETKEEMVKVCSYRPVEKTVVVKRVVAECIPVVVTQKVYDCVKVPYQVTIKVPVCQPVCCK